MYSILKMKSELEKYSKHNAEKALDNYIFHDRINEKLICESFK